MDQSTKSVSLRSVLLWSLLNWILLAIGASGFQIWAHHPYPRESLSFFVLLCGQVILSSLLFPAVARTPLTLVVNLMLTLPIDESGGMLSNLGQHQILQSWACTGVWICGMGAWRWIARTERAQLVVTTAAILFTAGGTFVDYLRSEAAAAHGQSQDFAPVSFLAGLCMGSSSTMMHQGSIPAILALFGVIFGRILCKPSTFSHTRD